VLAYQIGNALLGHLAVQLISKQGLALTLIIVQLKPTSLQHHNPAPAQAIGNVLYRQQFVLHPKPRQKPALM